LRSSRAELAVRAEGPHSPQDAKHQLEETMRDAKPAVGENLTAPADFQYNGLTARAQPRGILLGII
jgi:hypothetical protein